jgi:ribosome-associated protein
MDLSCAGANRIELAGGVWIGRGDAHFAFSRSGGPGGQNVNKVNTKAELRVRPEALQGIPPPALTRLRAGNASRITSEGELLLVCESSRSQEQNRAECVEKLRRIVVQALIEPKVRRKTRPTRASRERRLDFKKTRSAKKQQRRWQEE